MNPDLAKWDATMKHIDNMFPKSKHSLESLHRTENYHEHLHEREGQRDSFQQYQRRDEQYHIDDTWRASNWTYQPLIVVWIILIVLVCKFFLDCLRSMDRYFT